MIDEKRLQDIKGRLAQVRPQFRALAPAMDISWLISELEQSQAEPAKEQRRKYGTPCSCESWVKTCADLEDELAQARERVEVLERVLVAANRWGDSDPEERTEEPLIEALAALSSPRPDGDKEGR